VTVCPCLITTLPYVLTACVLLVTLYVCVMLQVCDHLQALGKQVGIRVIALVGGIATIKQVGGLIRRACMCSTILISSPHCHVW